MFHLNHTFSRRHLFKTPLIFLLLAVHTEAESQTSSWTESSSSWTKSNSSWTRSNSSYTEPNSSWRKSNSSSPIPNSSWTKSNYTRSARSHRSPRVRVRVTKSPHSWRCLIFERQSQLQWDFLTTMVAAASYTMGSGLVGSSCSKPRTKGSSTRPITWVVSAIQIHGQ